MRRIKEKEHGCWRKIRWSRISSYFMLGREQCLSHSATIPGAKELKRDEETRNYGFAAFKMKYHSPMPGFSLRICISGTASRALAEDAPLRAKSKGPGMRRVEVETVHCD